MASSTTSYSGGSDQPSSLGLTIEPVCWRDAGKKGHVAFIEVKTTASYPRRWMLQKKYATPKEDSIPLE